MLQRIIELADLLRQNGVRVSSAEVEDAARAMQAVGIGNREVVRGALRATMVKSAGHGALFDELFDLTFAAGVHGPLESTIELLERAGLDRDRAAQLMRDAAGDVARLDPLARMVLGMSAGRLSTLLSQASDQVGLGRMISPLQVGFYSHRVLDALNMVEVEKQLAAFLARTAEGGSTAAERDALGQVVTDGIAAIRVAAREHIERELRRRHMNELARARIEAMSKRPLVTLSEDEVALLRVEVARLARLLRARVSASPPRPRRGRLDVRRTLRASMATGGIPVSLYLRQRNPRRPRLVILCDISDSVRQVSRFLLELVYALSAHFDRVSSFAFVAELGELTDLFRKTRVDRAIDLAYSGRVVNVFANSDYGRVFQSFVDRHLGLVTRRSTVLIIGDGRNNYHPSRADCLATIRRRARRVIWLNPEAPPVWGFGDSAMKEYAPHCDHVAVARDLDSLRQVIDELIAPRRRRSAARLTA